MDLMEATDYINSTMSKYLAKDGTKKWRNGIARHSYHYADLVKSAKLNIQSGKEIVWTTMLSDRDRNGQWLMPNETIRRRLTNSSVEGRTSQRYYNTSWSLTNQEAEHNSGKEQIIKLPELKLEKLFTDQAADFEEMHFDPTGNFGSDRIPAGLKYYITRDGLAVDGSATVAGISVAEYPRWKNAYIGPLGASDGLAPITSITQLPDALNRMMDEVRFSSANGMAHAENDAEKWAAKNQRILWDRLSHLWWKKYMHARRDDMSKDMYAGEPVWAGLPMRSERLLGLGATGLPAGAAHDGITAGMTAGAFPNTGECIFENLEYLFPVVHPSYQPKRWPARFAEDQHTSFQDVETWQQLACDDRQRQGIIWGYGDIDLN